MLSLVNQVTLIGRAGHRPELLHATDGRPRAYLKLYQRERDAPDVPLVHHLVAWHSVAQQFHHRIRRGDRLLVEGKLRYATSRSDRGGGRTEIHVSGFSVLAGGADKSVEMPGTAHFSKDVPR